MATLPPEAMGGTTRVPGTWDGSVPEPAAAQAVRLADSARDATRFLKTFANQHRLTILCHLVEGERAFGELEQLLGIQQAHLSQQLARLRRDGLVRTRRVSRTIYYRLGSDEAKAMIGTLYGLFCRTPARG